MRSSRYLRKHAALLDRTGVLAGLPEGQSRCGLTSLEALSAPMPNLAQCTGGGQGHVRSPARSQALVQCLCELATILVATWIFLSLALKHLSSPSPPIIFITSYHRPSSLPQLVCESLLRVATTSDRRKQVQHLLDIGVNPNARFEVRACTRTTHRPHTTARRLRSCSVGRSFATHAIGSYALELPCALPAAQALAHSHARHSRHRYPHISHHGMCLAH